MTLTVRVAAHAKAANARNYKSGSTGDVYSEQGDR
jgi:hypothetical protein